MGIDWWVVEGLLTIAEITAKQLAELKCMVHGCKLRMMFRFWAATLMNGFPPQRLLLGLLPLLALLQGCKMPLLQEYLGERSKSIGFGSTIRVLVETRLGADPLDIKLNKSTISAEIREFERFNPDVKIQARFIPLVDLEREIKFQHTRGLGPDLILLTNNNALPFLRKNFIKPVSLNRFEILSIRNSLLPSFKHKGKLIGVPVFIFPQIACYNRLRLKKPPENLDELIKLSQNGYSFGINKNFDQLLWLYSGLGDALFEPRILPSSLSFLRWLKLANLQPTISFESDPLLLRSGLISGEFSWITCTGAWLPGLQSRMGEKLGTVMLPNVPTGNARPFLSARTWLFGSQSSGRQHELAKKFVLFSVNIVQQRNMALKLGTAVPVNPGISLPLKTNNILQLVNLAAERGKLLSLDQIDWLYKTDPVLMPDLNLVISGEQSPEAMAPRLNQLLKYGAKK